jgi:protein-tyrosine phosphatase
MSLVPRVRPVPQLAVASRVITSADPHPVTWLSTDHQVLKRVGVSSCPGKILAKGRNGLQYKRDISKDVKDLSKRGVSMIICLLNDYEMRTIGVSPVTYRKSCGVSGVELLVHPVLEMGVFSSVEDVNTLCTRVIASLESSPAGKVLVHCRGGVGRACTFAACLYVRILGLGSTDAIRMIRDFRCKKAVESKRQEEFVNQFAKFTF